MRASTPKADAHPALRSLLAAVAVCLLTACSEEPLCRLDGPAPALELPMLQGEPRPPNPLRGRPVYLDFWASWCAPCEASLPFLEDLRKRLGDEALTVIGVNLDEDRDAALAFAARHQVRFPMFWDPRRTSLARFGVQVLPASVLIRADGSLCHIEHGFRPEQTAAIEARVRALIAADGGSG